MVGASRASACCGPETIARQEQTFACLVTGNVDRRDVANSDGGLLVSIGACYRGIEIPCRNRLS